MAIRYVDGHLDFTCMMMRQLLPAWSVKSHQTFRTTHVNTKFLYPAMAGQGQTVIIHGQPFQCLLKIYTSGKATRNTCLALKCYLSIAYDRIGVIAIVYFIYHMYLKTCGKMCDQLVVIMYSSCTYYDYFLSKFIVQFGRFIYFSVNMTHITPQQTVASSVT